MDRGTYLPLPVSVKTVSSSPDSWTAFASGSGRPSCKRPCSRRYLRTKEISIQLSILEVSNQLTTPKHCYQAGYQLDRYEGEESIINDLSITNRNTATRIH